ncbi:MAG: hypothetical protein H6574_15980 [Lewinellaceae bacterium]|nr:hypothetical protein [Lewinellaceae bacterium]MCB9332581.1 hypothetical protein [Lewinellaceae bacterium]
MLNNQDIKALAVLFGSYYAGLWLFLESAAFFESGIVGSKGFYSHLLFAISALIFSVVTRLIVKKFYEPNPMKLLLDNIRRETNETKKLIVNILNDENKYKYKMLLWRLSTEKSKYSQINGGHWTIKALKKYDFIRYVFGHIVLSMDKNDEYLTLSCLDFWAEDRVGETAFFEKNFNKAVEGSTIKRIIIIDNEIFENPSPEFEKDRKNLIYLVEEFSDKYEKYEPLISKMTNFEIFFYLSKNYKKDIGTEVPYALLSNKEQNSFMAVLPYIPQDNFGTEVPHIEIWITNNENTNQYTDYKNKFTYFRNKTKDLLTVKDMAIKIKKLK